MIRYAVLAALLQAGALQAPAAGRTATLCLDPLGINLGATCRDFSGGSRIQSRPDICQCLNAGIPVSAPYCARSERPQAESADYDRARYAAAHADGTLVGKSYQGRSFCVAR